MPSPVTFPGVKCMKHNEREQKESRPPRWNRGRTDQGLVSPCPRRSIFHPPCLLRPSGRPQLVAAPGLPGPLASGRPMGGTVTTEDKRTETQVLLPCPLRAAAQGASNGCVPHLRLALSPVLLPSLCLGGTLLFGHPHSYRRFPSPCPHVCHEPLH